MKTPKGKYTEAVGRRKTATARVRLYEGGDKEGDWSFTVNNKPLNEYFKTKALQKTAQEAFSVVDQSQLFHVSAKVNGGGPRAQAEAIRHGIARVLVDLDENSRTSLKQKGFLKRDPRMKERRKFGLVKARKAKQWSKR